MKDISTFQTEVMSIGRLSQLGDIAATATTANIFISAGSLAGPLSSCVSCNDQCVASDIGDHGHHGHQVSGPGDKTIVTPDDGSHRSDGHHRQ